MMNGPENIGPNPSWKIFSVKLLFRGLFVIGYLIDILIGNTYNTRIQTRIPSSIQLPE